MLISTNSYILSQTDTVKIHVETLRKINLDLARLDYLDSAILRKQYTIENLYQLDSLRLDRIQDYQIEVQELTTHNTKLLKRSKNRFRLGALGGLILGLMTQLLF